MNLPQLNWMLLRRLCVFALLIVALMTLLPGSEAYAADPDSSCTNSSEYDITLPAPGTGLLSVIVSNINQTLTNMLVPGGSAQGGMFELIRTSGNVVGAIRAAATLYIAIYGLMFTFAIVEITVFDLVVRLAKLGVLVALLSPSAWTLFNSSVVEFFNNGTAELVSVVTSSALLGQANTSFDGSPFTAMDNAIYMIISPKMAATFIAAFTTGPYGIGIGLLLAMSLASFVKSLMYAMWVYIMALVMRTFLFGLAPLFIPCILFQRTKHLFDGWLNQLVNTMLQPVFLFAFFSFFVLLLISCMNQLFYQAPACWTPFTGGIRGPAQDMSIWRFGIYDCNMQQWTIFDGKWGFYGPENSQTACGAGTAPVNPIGIILPLTFWILSDLASRFNNVVVSIAQDIAQASTDLRTGAERIGQWTAAGGPSKDGTINRSGEGGSAIKQPGASGGAAGMRQTPGGVSTYSPPAKQAQEAFRGITQKAGDSIRNLVTPRR